MAIELNHTIVPVRDKEASARFYEKIFGFEHQEPLGHFQPVRIASQSLTLDFDDQKGDALFGPALSFATSRADTLLKRAVTAHTLATASKSSWCRTHW